MRKTREKRERKKRLKTRGVNSVTLFFTVFSLHVNFDSNIQCNVSHSSGTHTQVMHSFECSLSCSDGSFTRQIMWEVLLDMSPVKSTKSPSRRLNWSLKESNRQLNGRRGGPTFQFNSIEHEREPKTNVLFMCQRLEFVRESNCQTNCFHCLPLICHSKLNDKKLFKTPDQLL